MAHTNPHARRRLACGPARHRSLACGLAHQSAAGEVGLQEAEVTPPGGTPPGEPVYMPARQKGFLPTSCLLGGVPPGELVEDAGSDVEAGGFLRNQGRGGSWWVHDRGNCTGC
ncbi:uncharacterized protein PGTG_19515 [Puccinia graminis f. sp. tritici CRL 75-36-700-3]|uniref:Uncharacterized protein n=1 Tax=Puccinia graminis f. sp. tritici (strain CRL 75-36-700-3 / race SCCL) TaxID=418459 RepID=E3LAI6_PUCGT|nr:uncharacterized protein PGTG_19515 [Puccinia graminis f. sp. tritici CRL 75-36-700-3]EFP93561.1 hypothetical protein PGTG_19515 [Puccinia graminis f. sp. tritici CRL 75-36-700-3]